MKKVILFFSSLVLLTSCQTLSDRASAAFERITRKPIEIIGKTSSEALSILGSPNAKDILNNDTEAWYYIDPRESGFLIVRKNVVVENELFSPKRFFVKTESFSSDDAHLIKDLALISGIKGIPTEDLSFRARVKPLIELLKRSNYNLVSPNKASNFLIVTYGVTDPDIDVSVSSRPVYNWIPGQSTTSYISNGYGKNIGTINSSSEGYLAYGGQSVETTKTVTYTTYLHLELVKKSGKSFKQMWKLTSQTVSPIGDISWTLTPTIQMSSKFFGKNTNGSQVNTVPVNHPLLEYLKNL